MTSRFGLLTALCALPSLALAADGADGPRLFGVPVDFFLFVATLLGVALCCNVSACREPVLAGDGYR